MELVVTAEWMVGGTLEFDIESIISIYGRKAICYGEYGRNEHGIPHWTAHFIVPRSSTAPNSTYFVDEAEAV